MKRCAHPVRLGHVHVGVCDRRLAAAWYRCVLRLRAAQGGLVGRADVVDRGNGYSPYFAGLDGNRFEATGYDRAGLERALMR